MASSKTKPRLDAFSFEVRYAYGFTYLDRCGQVIVDVERGREGWVPANPNLNSGTLENPGLGATVTFGPENFVFSAFRTAGFKNLVAEADALWSIVKLNLGLSEWVRVGCRFQYLLPQESVEAAEKAVMRSPLRATLHGADMRWPDGYHEIKQEPCVTLERQNIEYKITLQSVIRTEGTSASTLIRTNPRHLPRNRRQARLEAIKARMSYERNPEYGAYLDIDCIHIEPEMVAPTLFVTEQHTRSEEFLFLVSNL